MITEGDQASSCDRPWYCFSGPLALEVLRPAVPCFGDRSIPSWPLQQILARTDCVPLSIVELIKPVIESGVLLTPDPLDGLRTVASVCDPDFAAGSGSIGSHQLGRLPGSAHRLAVRVIKCNRGSAAAPMDGAVAQLVGAELIIQRGVSPNAEYTFKQALVV